MTIDINKLRRLAQAATPGPWYATGKLTRYVEARIDGGLIQEVAACGPTKADGGYGPQQEANASLIAAANPATISELLDRLEAAEKERDAAELMSLALRAKVEAMERQEPVGVLHVGNYYGEELQDWEFEANQCACDKLNEVYVSNPTSLPLYALPGAQAQPAPSVPEGWKLVPTAESRHPAIYRMLAALHIADKTAGLSEWDSYRAMLAAAPEAKEIQL